MLTPEQAKAKLHDRNWREVERQSGCKYYVIRRIALGDFSGVKAVDLQKLSEYLERS